ncbi:MAG: UDP-N-acetylglucosamine--N-acetylmuramyl-(pentapeptide) pyrophosphoryl-undecaprenol N-acetylglucosamine transferase [Candidatus Magasanikbacteria bacterium]|jgi:UDP-N-acetylglucosamine--N-acetylmuramyl-(pentapeptide) pyrophosphoryl-undecaprenol N-acetylglucosamine transferase|nr:UDP-N-acetylglucosamine--N-acetylmuramyl-(pentapeptide) pyrophosphoryl-undecaprenol N-acetylglucosamine transferase [Candidatus Magasanikbacteria bacterium]MBT4221282.1 UDP-N-acetylglucosamine--N-acetylmuramyl-(pentapeptide) pyrophosphoryl-undecaprenol N-acetylglucosamine transferase [Candidatus Magasanikbacteria bacterium]MBT4350428.1 UDP-N-acetylglucosamine--N-acetylmuramyl-(pentapeptide) pyrophosphoryl-undecaprenol N-acetylglucosamine transferase [Candidatus Magasanikbacteria bacterium]MBT
MKVIFSGGGTLGPVTPLLAIKDIIETTYKEASFFWVGTRHGPEKMLVEKKGIPFQTISAGKFRRYKSFQNVLAPFRLSFGFLQSLIIMWKEKPDMCISVGGFVSVPLHAAAWLFGVKTWIHQQDVQVGLSNKLMAPIATIITIALKAHTASFPKRKTTWIGNPIRQDILTGDKEKARTLFHLKKEIPVVFVTGGGTGSQRVNQLVVEAVGDLEGICQVIHLSGKNRPQELVNNAERHFDYYQVHQFFTNEMKEAYAIADIVISRGGFGTIAEVAALKKPTILIPKPGHQEENVQFLADQDAVILMNETTSDGHGLAKVIKELLAHKKETKEMGERFSKVLPQAKEKEIIHVIKELYGT